jgi:tetratricopeptide (TPR) repeat protein
VGPNEGLCLTAKFNFAESLDRSGSKEEAIVLYLQVLEGLVDKYPERIDVINRLKQTLGVTYREVGRPGDGVAYLEEVYESEVKQGDIHDSASALVAIATNYRDMGQLQIAIEINLKAVELLEAEDIHNSRDDLIFAYERLKSIYELCSDIAMVERCDSTILRLSGD